MNTGHSGSLSTGHANSAMDMVSRLETMVLMGMDMPLAAIQSQIASAIDIIIQLGRIRDGSRKLLQVVEVKGVENGKVCLHELFRFREKKRTGKHRRNLGEERRTSLSGKITGCRIIVNIILGKNSFYYMLENFCCWIF